MLSLLMAHQSVPKEFMNLVKSCVYRKQPVEEAYCGSWFSNSLPTHEGVCPFLTIITRKWAEHGKDVSYMFKYPELRDTQDSDPWSVRKTCVYNSIDTHAKRSCWIFLHPKYDSIGETKQMEQLAQQVTVGEYVLQPIAQHVSLISTYLNAWREYLVHYEEELLTLVTYTPFNTLSAAMLTILLRHRQCQSWETNRSNQLH
jgi:hypothetical protein